WPCMFVTSLERGDGVSRGRSGGVQAPAARSCRPTMTQLITIQGDSSVDTCKYSSCILKSSEVEEEEEQGGERQRSRGPTRYLLTEPRRVGLGFQRASCQSHREHKRVFCGPVGVGSANGHFSSSCGERPRFLPGLGQRLG